MFPLPVRSATRLSHFSLPEGPYLASGRAQPAPAGVAFALDEIDFLARLLFLLKPFRSGKTLLGRRNQRARRDVLTAHELVGLRHRLGCRCTCNARCAGRQLPIDEAWLRCPDCAPLGVSDGLNAGIERHDLAGLRIECLETTALGDVAGADRTRRINGQLESDAALLPALESSGRIIFP